MPLFPKVTSPCPLKGNLAAAMDGDFCRMCQRQVFDLSAMSDVDRRAFLSGCDEDEVCVSYRLPLRAAIAAAALAAATPALAQDAQPAPSEAAVQAEPIAVEAESDQDMSEMVIIVGGIRNPSQAKLDVDSEDPAVPDLPVAYEDETPATPAS